jgi:hypothetical protein
MRAGVQFIQEEAIWLLPRNHGRRTETAFAINDLRHADEILWRQLTAQERDAGESHLLGKLLYERGFPNAWRPPYEHGPHHCRVQQEVT